MKTAIHTCCVLAFLLLAIPAVTPWFHLTADLQIVDNENEADDTAIIAGLRGKLDF